MRGKRTNGQMKIAGTRPSADERGQFVLIRVHPR